MKYTLILFFAMHFSFLFSAEVKVDHTALLQSLQEYCVEKSKKEIKIDCTNSYHYFTELKSSSFECALTTPAPHYKLFNHLARGGTANVAIATQPTRTLYFWNDTTPNNIGEYTFSTRKNLQSIAVSRDGKLIGACIKTQKTKDRGYESLYFYVLTQKNNTLQQLYNIRIKPLHISLSGKLDVWFSANNTIIAKNYYQDFVTQYNADCSHSDFDSLTENQKSLLHDIYCAYRKNENPYLMHIDFPLNRSQRSIYHSLPSNIQEWLNNMIIIRSF